LTGCNDFCIALNYDVTGVFGTRSGTDTGRIMAASGFYLGIAPYGDVAAATGCAANAGCGLAAGRLELDIAFDGDVADTAPCTADSAAYEAALC